jgi:hypothetical protein
MLVIRENGTGAVEGGWRGKTRGTAHFTFQRHTERQAATGATGAIEKGHLAPAIGAETGIGDRTATADAKRWEQKIEQRFGDRRGHSG